MFKLTLADVRASVDHFDEDMGGETAESAGCTHAVSLLKCGSSCTLVALQVATGKLRISFCPIQELLQEMMLSQKTA